MSHGLSERQLEALIEGRPISGGGEGVAEIGRFLAAVRNDFASDAAPVPRRGLAELLREGAVQPLATIPDLSARRQSRGTWTQRRVALVLAATLGALTVATVGLAGANALPRGLQQTVADVVGQVGIDLPSPTVDQPAHQVPGLSESSTTTPPTSRSGGGTRSSKGLTPPSTALPSTTLPSAALPSATLPKATVPALPSLTLPPVTLPTITVPTLPSGKP